MSFTTAHSLPVAVIGKVQDIQAGEVAYTPIEALRHRCRAVAGQATLFDVEIPGSVKLEGQSNGSVIASISDNAVELIMNGGGTQYLYLFAREPGVRQGFHEYTRLDRVNAQVLAAGRRRLRITEIEPRTRAVIG